MGLKKPQNSGAFIPRVQGSGKVDMSFPGRQIMFNKSFMSLCRFSGFRRLAILLAACLCVGARAQTAPAAIASFAVGVNLTNAATSSTIGTLGTIANLATDSFGDVLAVDAKNGALYEFPAGGGNAIVLVAAGGLAGTPVNVTVSNAIATPGIAIDSANNLYIEGGSCILMYPYDSKTNTWDALSALNSGGPTSANVCGATGTAPTFYNFGTTTQPWAIAINTNSASLVVGASPTGATAGGSIVSIPVTGGWAAPVAGTPSTIISGMAGAPISVSQDASGDTYFVEDGTGALSGAYKIPAGQTGLTTDSGLARIDPSLPQVTGAAADAHGNVYIGDNTLGVFVLPEGAKSSSSAFLLTTVTAQGEVGFSGNTGLVVPTTQTQSNGYGDVAEISFNAAQFGAVGVGAAAASGQVTFTFNASTTPTKIEVLEAGKSTPDFTVNAGAKSTCLSTQLLPPYAAQTGCPVSISFAPLAAGNLSATLVMLGANNALLASIPLDGSGTGAAVQALPAAQSTIGAGGSLKNPSQIAVDAEGNLYVADSGLKTVEMYPAGSASGTAGTPVGTGLTAPTGVAVDGAGDVFIADSGSVYEVPESESGSGLNAKGQITLKTGLGSQVQLAADGLGDLYISDAGKQQVLELENFSTGLNTSLPGVLATQTVTLSGAAVGAPSAIAVDSSNDVFVVDDGSVYEITPAGTQSQVLTGLTGINGLAVDPSGSVLVSATGGAVRIPSVSGVLTQADETTVATGVTNPTAVALDSLGNIYVADGSALDVNFSSASANLNFGTLTADPPNAGSSATQTATLLNYGNAPLKVTGYDSVLNYIQPTNAAAGYTVADFTETADTCSGNTIAVGQNCQATITFSPAPGDGGNLSEQVLVQGNVSNAPVGMNATGVAPTLASVTLSAPTSTTGTVENVPVSVTVAPKVSGSPTPTGTVTLTVVYGSNVPITYPALPTKYQLTAPLQNGVATFNSAVATAQGMPFGGLPIANYTFTARYNGDAAYTYATSSASSPVSVTNAVSTVIMEPTISASALNTPPDAPQQLEPYTLPCTSGPPGNCTTSYNWGQPPSNPPGYLVVAGNCSSGCVGNWGSDGSVQYWLYNYPLVVASTSGDLMVGTAAYEGQSSPVGANLGAVSYAGTSGSLCGAEAGSASIVNVGQVNDVDTAPFGVQCAPIIGINGAVVPIFMAFYTFTPQYSGEYSDLSETNPNYKSSTSTPVNIWGVAHPVVQISSSPAALVVAPGSSVTATLTLTSVLGYGYITRDDGPTQSTNYAMPLALQCQGLPAYASCSFTYPTPNPADPQSVSYPVGALAAPYNTVAFPAFGGLLCQNSTAAAPVYCAIDIGPPLGFVPGKSGKAPCTAQDGCLGPGNVIMTINTNVPVGTASNLKTSQGGIAFASIFGLGLLGLTFRRKVTRFRSLFVIVYALLWGGTLLGITACSTTTLGTPTATSGVTPSGTYWVTVTASQAGELVIPPLIYNDFHATLNVGDGDQMSLPYTINVTVTSK
jgi:sugar lactone lactonase YvrE